MQAKYRIINAYDFAYKSHVIKLQKFTWFRIWWTIDYWFVNPEDKEDVMWTVQRLKTYLAKYIKRNDTTTTLNLNILFDADGNEIK